MSILQEFDVQTQGVVVVTEKWKANHDALRQSIWPVEDVIARQCQLLESAAAIFDDFRRSRTLAELSQPLAYFGRVLQEAVRAAHGVIDALQEQPAGGEEVRGAELLKRRIEQAEQTLEDAGDLLEAEAALRAGAPHSLDDVRKELDI